MVTKQLTASNKANVKVNVDRNYQKVISVTRETFEAITESLLDQAIELTRNVFERLENDGKKVDKILLVGGSTKMPQIRRAITESFGIEPVGNEPDEAVSKGATMYAAWLAANVQSIAPSGGDGENVIGPHSSPSENAKFGSDTVTKVETDEAGNTTLYLQNDQGEEHEVFLVVPPKIQQKKIVTVASKSIGIVVLKRPENISVVQNLITKDDPLPVNFTQKFGLATANMTSVGIQMYQSEARNDNNDGWVDFYDPDSGIGVMIGEGTLSGLPAGLPAGTLVEITITMTEAGLIEITGALNGQPLVGSVKREYTEGVGSMDV